MPTNSERVRLWGGRSEVIGAGSKWRFAGFGFGPYYEYYPYAYNDYYDDGRCYVVRRSVMTHHGWRVRPVQACSDERVKWFNATKGYVFYSTGRRNKGRVRPYLGR
jgi:hypothetical protein